MTRRQKKQKRDRIIITIAVMLEILILLYAITKPAESADPEPSITIENSSQSVSSWDWNANITLAEPSAERTIVSPQDDISLPSPEPTVDPEPTQPPRYGFTDADIYLLAQLLCGSGTKDGDGEYDIDFQKTVNYNEVSKVLSVVMNRVRSPKFPNTVYKVVMAPGQFSVMPKNSYKTPSDKALKAVKEWCEAYDNYDPGVQVIPETHLYFTGNGSINITR